MAAAVLWRHLAWDGPGDWHDAGRLTSQPCIRIWGTCFLAVLLPPLFMTLGTSQGFITHTKRQTWTATLGLNPRIQVQVSIVPSVERPQCPSLAEVGRGDFWATQQLPG